MASSLGGQLVRSFALFDSINTWSNSQSAIFCCATTTLRRIVLATKYSGVSRHKPEKVHLKTNFGGNGSKSMRLSLEESLRRLQTSYVDVFYLHWWDYATSIEELMHSLNDLVSSGKVLYLGISDTPAWVVARANQYARSNGLRQFSVYQGMEIIPICRAEGMGICPYGVLNQGRFQTEDGYKEREKNKPGRKSVPPHQHDKDVSRVLERISKAKDENTGILQVALAYVMQKAPYVFPIVGGRTLEHIKGNIAGLSLALTEKDIEDIESAYRFDPGFPHTFLSGSLLKGHDATPKGAYNPSEVWYVDTMGTIDFVEPLKPIKPSQK
ncbi:Aldo/keto reductase [Lipomyces doorenjongii]